MPRPNIIFIQSDSHDGRSMGCMDHPAAHTPTLDALSERGTLFRNAYCNAPVCCPSRASMWSGRYPHEIEAWNNGRGLSPDDPTFVTSLQNAGYRTEIVGRTDHHSGAHTLGCWLSAWTRSAGITRSRAHVPHAAVTGEGTRVRLGDWKHVDRAAAWIHTQAREGENPFFLHVGFVHPHPMRGYNTSPHYAALIDPTEVTIPPREENEHPVMRYARLVKGVNELPPEDEIRRIRHHYLCMCAEVDEMIRTILQAADDEGLLDSTVVVYTSDHGDVTMEHGQSRKSVMFEGSVRVPLVVAGPGVARGHVADEFVSLVDVFPTLMDLAGAPHPRGIVGSSLGPLAGGATDASRDAAFCQSNGGLVCTGNYMLRRRDLKYVAYPGYEPQLFDLSSDPWEVHDLAPSRPDAVAEMDARLRTIVDYESADAAAKRQDRDDFTRWRASLGEDGYRAAMVEWFPGWDEGDFGRIEEWVTTTSSA